VGVPNPPSGTKHKVKRQSVILI